MHSSRLPRNAGIENCNWDPTPANAKPSACVCSLTILMNNSLQASGHIESAASADSAPEGAPSSSTFQPPDDSLRQHYLSSSFSSASHFPPLTAHPPYTLCPDTLPPQMGAPQPSHHRCRAISARRGCKSNPALLDTAAPRLSSQGQYRA